MTILQKLSWGRESHSIIDACYNSLYYVYNYTQKACMCRSNSFLTTFKQTRRKIIDFWDCNAYQFIAKYFIVGTIVRIFMSNSSIVQCGDQLRLTFASLVANRQPDCYCYWSLSVNKFLFFFFNIALLRTLLLAHTSLIIMRDTLRNMVGSPPPRVFQ